MGLGELVAGGGKDEAGPLRAITRAWTAKTGETDVIQEGTKVISDCENWTLSQRKPGVVVAVIRDVLAIVEFREPGLAGYLDIDERGVWRRGCFLSELHER